MIPQLRTLVVGLESLEQVMDVLWNGLSPANSQRPLPIPARASNAICEMQAAGVDGGHIWAWVVDHRSAEAPGWLKQFVPDHE